MSGEAYWEMPSLGPPKSTVTRCGNLAGAGEQPDVRRLSAEPAGQETPHAGALNRQSNLLKELSRREARFAPF